MDLFVFCLGGSLIGVTIALGKRHTSISTGQRIEARNIGLAQSHGDAFRARSQALLLEIMGAGKEGIAIEELARRGVEIAPAQAGPMRGLHQRAAIGEGRQDRSADRKLACQILGCGLIYLGGRNRIAEQGTRLQMGQGCLIDPFALLGGTEIRPVIFGERERRHLAQFPDPLRLGVVSAFERAALEQELANMPDQQRQGEKTEKDRHFAPELPRKSRRPG